MTTPSTQVAPGGVPPIGGGGFDSGAGFTPNPPPASLTPPITDSYSPPPVTGASGGLPIVPIVIVVVVMLVIGLFLMRGRSKPAAAPTTVATSPATPARPQSPASPATPSSPSSPSSPNTPAGLPTRPGATTTVKLVDPVMCRSVDNVGKPVDPTKRYEPRWPFFCSVRALGVKKGTQLVAVWQRPDGKTNKREITSDRVGDYYVYFTVNPRNDVPWDIGRYSLSLIADGVLQQTVEFEVISPGGATGDTGKPAEASGHIEEAVTCKSVDERRRPVDATSTFSPDVGAVYVAVHARDVERGKAVVTRWSFEGKPIKEVRIDVPRNASGWLSFKVTNSRWPVGAYKVEVEYDGSVARTVDFTVR